MGGVINGLTMNVFRCLRGRLRPPVASSDRFAGPIPEGKFHSFTLRADGDELRGRDPASDCLSPGRGAGKDDGRGHRVAEKAGSLGTSLEVRHPTDGLHCCRLVHPAGGFVLASAKL